MQGKGDRLMFPRCLLHVRHWTEIFYIGDLISCSQQPCKVGGFILITPLRKQRLWLVKKLTQHYLASKWQNWDVLLGPTLKPTRWFCSQSPHTCFSNQCCVQKHGSGGRQAISYFPRGLPLWSSAQRLLWSIRPSRSLCRLQPSHAPSLKTNL